MKRYALFMFDTYYPGGGWNDFIGSYDTLEDAMAAYLEHTEGNFHVVDLQTGKIVESN